MKDFYKINNESYDRSSHSFSIPNALMALSFLTQTEKMIIKRIVSLSSKYLDKGGCSLSNSSLAEDHDCSVSTVSNAISKAEWLGFVKKREDIKTEYELQDGNKTVCQIRRLVMVIPDFFEGVGELWADGYHTGDKDARYLIKKINEHLSNKVKYKNKKSGEGIEEGLFALASEFFDDEAMGLWFDYKDQIKEGVSLEFKTPPLKNLRGPLVRNPSLITLTIYNTYFIKQYNPSCDIPLKNIESKPLGRKRTSPPKSKEIEHPQENRYQKYADQLYQIISSKKKIKFNPSQIKTWGRDIAKLIKQNKISPARVQAALDWYRIHIGENEYIPVIESGASFRSKFLRLEAAMERSKKPFKAKKAPGAFPEVPKERENRFTDYSKVEVRRIDFCQD